MPWLRQLAVRQLPSGEAAIAFRLGKNLVSPNCEHDCENSPDQSSQAPYYLIARERLTPQIPETVLTPPDHGALSDHARAGRMGRLKAAAWVSGDPFHTEVRRQVALYFQREGTDSKGGARVWRKATLLLAWLAASWATFLFTTTGLAETMLLAASAGLAMAGIGFNIQHDGSHRSLSRRRWMNRIAAASLDLLGGSSYIWHWKHNVLHHSSPNVSGVDEDIDLGGLGRLSPLQEWRPLYRYQHVYLWFAYGFLPFKWHWYDDFAAFLRGRVGAQNIPRSRGAVVGLLLGKSVFVTWALLLPLLFQPAGRVLLFYVTCCCVLGFTLSSVFQMAHCVPEGFDPPVNDAQRPSWAAHQVASTVNFAGANRLLGWYVGGLNFQIEHHLFPGVSHVHYPKLAPLVASVCRKYGVRYTSRTTLWQAIQAHHRWLRHLGQPESAALSYVDRADLRHVGEIDDVHTFR